VIVDDLDARLFAPLEKALSKAWGVKQPQRFRVEAWHSNCLGSAWGWQPFWLAVGRCDGHQELGNAHARDGLTETGNAKRRATPAFGHAGDYRHDASS
jgi:hypothetical protein